MPLLFRAKTFPFSKLGPHPPPAPFQDGADEQLSISRSNLGRRWWGVGAYGNEVANPVPSNVGKVKEVDGGVRWWGW